MAKKDSLLNRVKNLASQQKDEAQPSIDYPVSTQAAEEPVVHASMLSSHLQEIARLYVQARRRSGEALLEAARWLHEARAEAKHGEWAIFLEATATSADTAERLINIHDQAMQNPRFAEAISNNWMGQSVAALLARPSTPPEVVEQILEEGQPVSVSEVRQRIKQHQQNPQIAEFEMPTQPENPQIAEFEIPTQQVHATELLHEIVLSLEGLQALVNVLPGDQYTLQQLEQAEELLRAIRQNLSS
jgi:hypothetical protein